MNDMEKHNKDLEKIRMERDSFQTTLKQIDANYWNLKAKKNSLNVERKKLQKWTEICKRRWFLMKSCKNFQSRPRESSPSIMKMSSKKIMNSRSNVLCFK